MRIAWVFSEPAWTVWGAVLRVGESPWGAVSLFRRRGQAPFSGRDTELVASLSAPLGEAIRVRARPGDLIGGPVPDGQPGELVAKLSADWYEPIHLQEVARVSDN